MKNTLSHHGILGQKWGVRRFQNKDGSLTEKGKKRYDQTEKKFNKKLARSEQFDSKIMLKREQNIAKVQARFDKKIHKAQSAGKDEKSSVLMKRKDAITKNFDQATKDIQAAFKKYNDIIKNYRDVKLSQLSNTSSKKAEEEVQRIIKAYKKQRRSDIFNASSGGMASTKTKYAFEQYSKKDKR